MLPGREMDGGEETVVGSFSSERRERDMSSDLHYFSTPNKPPAFAQANAASRELGLKDLIACLTLLALVD